MKTRCPLWYRITRSIILSAVFAAVAPALAFSTDRAVRPKDSLHALAEFTSSGHIIGFASDSVYVAGGSHALRVEFVGANAVAPQSDTPADTHGNAAPPLSRVIYANLWDGITLTFDAAHGGVVSSAYRLAPNADPKAIRLRYNAPVTLNDNCGLNIAFATGMMIESAPRAWQEAAGGTSVPVAVAFALRADREVDFAVGTYDASRPLFIDPTLTWSTFLGGTGDDRGNAIAVDATGNVYVAGNSGNSSASWGSPVRAYTEGSADAFAAKLDPNGTLIWNTFLGGTLYDLGSAIAVDGSGNVYVGGNSTGTWGSPVRPYSGGASADAYAAKLDSNGALIWNTFLGAGGTDYGNAIAVDGTGNVYVGGYSSATWGVPVRPYTSGQDAFAAKVDPNGTLIWNTFLGGSGTDYGNGIGVYWLSEYVYVGGYGDATWGSPIRPYTNQNDAFVAQLDSNGVLIWNTFLGGTGTDYGFGLVVDQGGANAYLAGSSNATWGSPVHNFTGGADAFAAKLDPNGNLTWSTFFGGIGTDQGIAIAVGPSYQVYLGGYSDFTGPGFSAFVARFKFAGELLWSAYLGGSGADYGYGIAPLGSNSVYVAGWSDATWGSPVRPFTSGIYDAFAAQISGAVTPPVYEDDFENAGDLAGWTTNKGTWAVNTGALVGTFTKSATAFAPYTMCTNCTVEGDLQTAGGKGNQVSLYGWFVDMHNVVELVMKQGNGKWILQHKVLGVRVAKRSFKMPIAPNTNYHAAITYDGANFVVSIDGMSIISVPSVTPQPGAPGFKVKGTTGTFLDILVSN